MGVVFALALREEGAEPRGTEAPADPDADAEWAGAGSENFSSSSSSSLSLSLLSLTTIVRPPILFAPVNTALVPASDSGELSITMTSRLREEVEMCALMLVVAVLFCVPLLDGVEAALALALVRLLRTAAAAVGVPFAFADTWPDPPAPPLRVRGLCAGTVAAVEGCVGCVGGLPLPLPPWESAPSTPASSAEEEEEERDATLSERWRRLERLPLPDRWGTGLTMPGLGGPSTAPAPAALWVPADTPAWTESLDADSRLWADRLGCCNAPPPPLPPLTRLDGGKLVNVGTTPVFTPPWGWWEEEEGREGGLEVAVVVV